MSRARAAGLLIGFAADRRWGDPRRGHPVAAFGTVAATLERRWYADSVPRGAFHSAVLVGGVVAVGVAVEHAVRGRPLLTTAVTAAATWTVLGGRSLEREALAVHAYLADGDLPGARQRLTHLVGRDPSELSGEEVARAVVESVAENTSDAVTAPLVWGLVAGVPGLFAHRAANTLDAMVGHRNARYERFGKAPARLDDLLNLPGSRYAGVLVMLARPQRAGDAWRAWRRDASGHPSPNAGVVESTFAGALGIVLGGVNRYGARVESRPRMGDGRAVAVRDIPASTRLARRVGWLAAAGAAAAAASTGPRRTR